MTPNSIFILERGGQMRRHRYLRDLGLFFVPAMVSIILQTFVYAMVIGRVGRADWLLPGLILAPVPAVSALVLVAFRRHEFPVTSAVIVTLAVLSAAVSFLSALRIPVSYLGILFCAPVPVVCMIYTNVRFHNAAAGRAALLDFPGAKAIAGMLHVEVVKEFVDLDYLLVDPRQPLDPEILNRYFMSGIEIMPWTKYLELRFGRVDVESFDIAHIRLTPSQILYTGSKRYLDLLFIVVSLPFTIPLAMMVSAYVLIRDGRPLIFKQTRRGYGGQSFSIYKFRTMYRNSDGQVTMHGDKRIIPGGRFIRRWRLDELPQLVNVLKGEMSLIGPRPVANYVAIAAEALEPKYAQRYLVAPGLTGWAQANAPYAGSSAEEVLKLSYDLYYLKYQSLDLDLLILARTMATLVLGRGAR